MPRVTSDVSACIGAGICANTAPGVFGVGTGGLVVILAADVRPEDIASARAAVEICPAQALAWVGEGA